MMCRPSKDFHGRNRAGGESSRALCNHGLGLTWLLLSVPMAQLTEATARPWIATCSETRPIWSRAAPTTEEACGTGGEERGQAGRRRLSSLGLKLEVAGGGVDTQRRLVGEGCERRDAVFPTRGQSTDTPNLYVEVHWAWDNDAASDLYHIMLICNYGEFRCRGGGEHSINKRY